MTGGRVVRCLVVQRKGLEISHELSGKALRTDLTIVTDTDAKATAQQYYQGNNTEILNSA